MPRGGPLGNRISDPWSYAIVGATFSIPLTVLTYWQTGSELALSPVLLGGLIAGYLATHRTGTSAGVGSRAGLLGGLPAVWIVPEVLSASAALTGPPWFLAAGSIMTALTMVGFLVLAFGLSTLAGALGGYIGGRLAGTPDDGRPPVAGG